MTLSREQREALRREAVAELWRRREVWPLLEVLLDRDQLDDARAFFAGCDVQRGQMPPDDWVDDISRQRGKSWKWCAVAAVLCHCVPGFIVKYAAQLQLSVRQIVQPTLAAILEGCPAELRPRFNGVDNQWVWTHPDGRQSTVTAAGANLGHYAALRGQKAHLLIQDEAAFYDDFDAVQRALRPQLQTTAGACVYATTPPESPDHPYEAVCAAAKARGRYVHRTIHGTAQRGHPRLSKAEVEAVLLREARLKGQTLEQFKRTTYYKREFLCMHVVEETRAVVPEWSWDADVSNPDGRTLADVLTRESPRPVFFDTYDGLDIGFTRDPSAVVAGYWDFERACLVVEDETPPLYRNRTDQLAEEVRALRKRLWPATAPRPFPEARLDPKGEHWLPQGSVGDAGGLGAETILELSKEHDLHFAPAQKEQVEVMVNDVRRLVAAGKLEVHPRCVNLRKQLARGLWADKTKTEFERTTDGHLDHLAALVYLVRIVDRQRNPMPRGYGLDPTHMVMTTSGRSQGADNALSDVF